MQNAISAQNVRHRKNTAKPNTKRTSELPRINRKSIKNRSAGASDCVWRRERRGERLRNCPGGTWSVSGAPRGRLWTTHGRSWLARGAPRAALGWHLGVQTPFQAHLDASTKRPWVPKTAPDRFFVDLGWIFVDFRTMVRRFSLEPRATKAASQKGVA